MEVHISWEIDCSYFGGSIWVSEMYFRAIAYSLTLPVNSYETVIENPGQPFQYS